MNSLHDRGMAARVVRPLSHFTLFCIAIVFLLVIVGPVSAALPKVTSVSPTSGWTSGGTSVIITGTGFVNVKYVRFGTTPNATGAMTVDSPTQITVTSPAHSVGTVDVTVTNKSGTSSTYYANDHFTYVTPVPTVTGINPTSGPTTGGTSVVITGTGFVKVKYVTFGSTRNTTGAMTVDSDTQITVTSPPHYAGTVDVKVYNNSGSSATSAADRFTYMDLPSVYSVTPKSGPSSGGTLVTITGDHFTGLMGVKFGDTLSGSITFVNDDKVTALSPPGSGMVDVRVITPAGISPVVQNVCPSGYITTGNNVDVSTPSCECYNDTFTYTGLPPPTVISVVIANPSTGCMLGGNTVTITGTGFTGADYVLFGSTPNATGQMTVDSDTQITVTSPPGSGTVDVTVHTPSGSSALNPPADYFIYTPVPTVTLVTPPNGPLGGGNTVIINGTYFTGATSVKFGGVDALTFTVDNDVGITATSPAGTGTVHVTVTTCSGTSETSSADYFTYFPDTLTPVMGDWTGTGPNTVGLYEKDNGAFFLRNTNTYGDADTVTLFGPIDYSGDLVPMVGNWTGSSYVDGIGLYQKSTGTFFLKNDDSPGPADNVFQFGPISSSGDMVPIVGDWTGSGKDTIGLYQNSTGLFFLKNDNSAGPADNVFQFGIISSGDMVPIVGDWTGKGFDSVGLYQKSTGMFFLKNDNSAGPADNVFNYGPAVSGDIVPVAGDWTHSGIDTIGIYQHSTAFFFLKNSNTYGDADFAFPYGWVIT